MCLVRERLCYTFYLLLDRSPAWDGKKRGMNFEVVVKNNRIRWLSDYLHMNME